MIKISCSDPYEAKSRQKMNLNGSNRPQPTAAHIDGDKEGRRLSFGNSPIYYI